MTIEPAGIRAEISELLGDLPDIGDDIDHSALEAVAHRLEEAHEVLVRALESVDPTSVAARAAAHTEDDAQHINEPEVINQVDQTADAGEPDVTNQPAGGAVDLDAGQLPGSAQPFVSPQSSGPTWETDG